MPQKIKVPERKDREKEVPEIKKDDLTTPAEESDDLDISELVDKDALKKADALIEKYREKGGE